MSMCPSAYVLTLERSKPTREGVVEANVGLDQEDTQLTQADVVRPRQGTYS